MVQDDDTGMEQMSDKSNLTEEDLKRLETLAEQAGFVSKGALLRKALDLFEEHVQKTRKTRKRVQLDFAGEDMKRLDELAKREGLDSKAELVRNALRFFEWYLIQVKQGGYHLALKKGEECKAVEIVF